MNIKSFCTRRFLLSAAIAAGSMLGLSALPAQASDYPNRIIKLVVAFPPGGATDVLARVMAAHLSNALGQQMIVENRPGAGGNVGSSSVARSAPDGYTLLIGAAGNITINPALYTNMPYDPRELVPVGSIASTMNLLVVHPSVEANSVQELIALAKKNPGKLNFASSGNGSSLHMSGEMFKTMVGIDMLHVPYRGSAPAMNDLLTGQVQMMFDNLPSSLPHVKAGKLRALGVTGKERSKALPEVPTIAEQGLPDYEALSWFGIFAPKGTPADIVARLNKEMQAGIANPDVLERINSVGAEPLGLSQEKFASMVASEFVKWEAVVKQSGAKVE